MTRAPITWRDHAVGFALCAVYLAILLVTSRDLGMSRDEGFYVEASDRYAAWLAILADDPSRALAREVIDAHWETNHEHPSLVKSAFALSVLADRAWEIFPQRSMAYRFPGMLFAGLALWLVYLFGARAIGRREGAFAAFAFATMPNVFYHSHLACFDIPIVTMLTLVTYCYWRSLAEPRWAIATGLAYGLALETKHNAWILPLVLLVHWLAFVVPSELALRRAGKPVRIPLVPWWLVAMAAIGPIVFVALWPWLWHDTAARFAEYAAFHVHHVHYTNTYLGETYFGPPSPFSFPWVMTLFTTSVVTVLLGLGGVALRTRQWLPQWMPARRPKVEGDRERTAALMVGCMLAPPLVIAMPWSPIFGGTKHFLAGWVFLALFAGIGFVQVGDALAQWMPIARLRSASHAIAAALLLAPSIVSTAHSHPFGLSFYGLAAGGVPGAADLGMIRQFWGFTTGSLAPWLNANVPEGGSVWICDTVPTAWRMLQEDGRLRRDIRIAYDLASADYAIVHHEDHFVEVDDQIWVAFGRVDPVYVLTYDGVPIISVYARAR